MLVVSTKSSVSETESTVKLGTMEHRSDRNDWVMEEWNNQIWSSQYPEHQKIMHSNEVGNTIPFCKNNLWNIWNIKAQYYLFPHHNFLTHNTAKNTIISPDFFVWKFFRKAQFPHSFGRFTRNYVENVPFCKILDQEMWLNYGTFRSVNHAIHSKRLKS